MIPIPPTPARREEPPEKLSLLELFALFNRGGDDTRWLSAADSQEYLALISWLVQRSSREH